MRIISFNANGIRSAANKGFFDWLRLQQADVVCLQETKAQEDQLTDPMFRPDGHHCFYRDAITKKGYSGVALYSKLPHRHSAGFGHAEFDSEGRFLQADFADVSIVSLYLPSGSSGPHRQASKYRFLDAFLPHLERLVRSGREVILCGDWNIAHQPIDLRNWRGNQKNSGFLPDERAWLTRVFDDLGFVDVFRRVDPRPEQYTWWSNRGQAWKKNVGWRIDYQIATPAIAASAHAVSIYKNRRFSDHAPLTIDYDFELR